jgi:hypothetical protein
LKANIGLPPKGFRSLIQSGFEKSTARTTVTGNDGVRKRLFAFPTSRIQYLGFWRDASIDQFNLSLQKTSVVHGFHDISVPVLLNLLIAVHHCPKLELLEAIEIPAFTQTQCSIRRRRRARYDFNSGLERIMNEETAMFEASLKPQPQDLAIFGGRRRSWSHCM